MNKFFSIVIIIAVLSNLSGCLTYDPRRAEQYTYSEHETRSYSLDQTIQIGGPPEDIGSYNDRRMDAYNRHIEPR